jgi:hypothetical protein
VSHLFGVLVFAATAMVLTSAALYLWYETFAYATGQDPTLSRILAYAIDTAPPQLAVWVGATAGLLVGVVGTVLSLHFAGLLNWWKP